jgi:hypothetical protein
MAVQPEKIESGKGEETLRPKKIVKDWPALAIEGNNFAVQNRLSALENPGHPVPQLDEPLQPNVPSGPDLTTHARGIEHSAETIVLGLEKPAGLVEGIGPRHQGNRGHLRQPAR